MLSAASRGARKLANQRYISLTASSHSDVKTGNIAEYKVVDHAYDAIVVGAGRRIPL